MDDIKIRRANVADVENIARIAFYAWQDSFQDIVPDEILENLTDERFITQIKSDLEEKDRVIFVAEILTENSEKEIIGFISGGTCRKEREGFQGEVYANYVLPQWKKKGIGRKLFHTLLDWMRECGFKAMFLWTLKDNQSARFFYELMGGKLIDKGKIEIGKWLDKVCYGYIL